MGKEYLIPIFSIADLLGLISQATIDDKYQLVVEHRSFSVNNEISWSWIVSFRNKQVPVENYITPSLNPELIDAIYDYTIKLIRKGDISKIPCKKYYPDKLIPGQKFIVDDPYNPLLGETLEFVKYYYSNNYERLVCRSCRDNLEHYININSLTMI